MFWILIIVSNKHSYPKETYALEKSVLVALVCVSSHTPSPTLLGLD